MKDPDCLFCKIIDGKIPSTKIFENQHVLGFKDLRPEATVHYLFIHKNHSADVNDLVQIEPQQLIHIFTAIKEVSEKEKLSKNGFRVVTNQGANAGQTVFHTHFHLVGGEPLGHFGAN